MLFKRNHNFKTFLPFLLLGTGALLLGIALWSASAPGDTDSAAASLERRLSLRMSILDGYMDEVLTRGDEDWVDIQSIPEDMVVYLYERDSLKCWNNQFPIMTDDISTRVVFQRLSNPRAELYSPLRSVSSEVSFLNLGPKWYLIKCIDDEEHKVIAGLEIMDSGDDSHINGVNPRLHLGDKFSIKPLSFSGGSAVSLGGVPQFKVLYDSLQGSTLTSPALIWLAFAFFLAGVITFLSNNRGRYHYLLSLVAVLVSSGAMYMWGRGINVDSVLFSPTLFADGPFLCSLGAVLIVNIAIVAFVLCTYLVRNDIYRAVRAEKGKALFVFCSLLIVIVIAGMVVYTQYVFRSIIRNSNISLELYKLNDISVYTALVYVSFVTLLMTIPLLFQMLRPGLKHSLNIRYDAISNRSRVIFAGVFSIYLVIISSVLGFRKEQDRLGVWANMLSIDRDISLELELRSVENNIASDVFISTLSLLDNSAVTILNRISENYLYRVSQDYDISVFILNDRTSSPASTAFFNERVGSGTPISDSSYFLYTISNTGHVRYTGVFIYFNPSYGATRMLVSVEPKSNRENKGYSKILGVTTPGQVNIPSQYSYAKYNQADLVSYRGNYAYPTRLDKELYAVVDEGEVKHFSKDSFRHFLNYVSDDETVLISRPKIGVLNYCLSFVLIALFAYVALSVMSLRRRHTAELFEKNYYRLRVSLIVAVSLIVTLIVMSLVSVIFVYKRNEVNIRSGMSAKVTSIQAIVENYCRDVNSFLDLNNQEFNTTLKAIGEMTNSDIILYSTDGKAFLTTDSDLFENFLIGSRLDEDAYYNIKYKNKRYFIGDSQIYGKKFHSLYSPVFNEQGDMIAVLCSPYTEENFDFGMEAVRHSVSILTVFLLLLIFSRFMTTAIVDRMFKPLVVMGKRMNASSLGAMDHIEYDRDDEISTLVSAYNRMVDDLSESTRKLAQAERDKAWSAMARQVAHEIKNPLTPMKLQLQRLIRMKDKDDSNWQDKFDEVAKVVLDHIDILSDTANQFSTFAKLYSEEPASIDLDSILQEEISMFDNRERVEFSYMGLQGAVTMGPKPQLTRVFVNILGNAVQAVENEGGRIMVSLRKSNSEGYYDIVIEDDGPGVAEENIPKLFTPNFTTKSGGTGLGLAISRSILEKCNATIEYSKSFSLGGACFKITYPIISA